MIEKKIVYTDFTDDNLSKIAKIKAQFNYDGIFFQVELNDKVYNCLLFKDEIWYVRLLDFNESISLARLSDTYWNSRHIWQYIDDGELSCVIGGAIKEIYSVSPVLFD